MSFYEILNNIMERQNLSIPEVARKCDLADSTIRSIIARKTKKVSLDVAFKLSKGLNITLEELNGDIPPSVLLYTPKETKYIEDLRKLNDDGIEKAINYTKDLTEMPKYKKVDNITALPKQEIWEEEGKEHLMPIASHDDGLTEEQKNMMNEKIAEFLKTLK